jgi:hypothetical protein
VLPLTNASSHYFISLLSDSQSWRTVTHCVELVEIAHAFRLLLHQLGALPFVVQNILPLCTIVPLVRPVLGVVRGRLIGSIRRSVGYLTLRVGMLSSVLSRSMVAKGAKDRTSEVSSCRVLDVAAFF